MMSFVKELWMFLRVRKKFWLLPILGHALIRLLGIPEPVTAAAAAGGERNAQNAAVEIVL